MTEKVKTEAEGRAIVIRQLDRMIDYLKSIKSGVELGVIHYHGGEITVSEEIDEIDLTHGATVFKLPEKRTWRINGDLVFGTQKKENTNETDQ